MTKIGAGLAARESVWRPGRPVDVRRTLGTLVRGPRDPAHRTSVEGMFWRAALTPHGPATLALRVPALGEVHAAAWGPGAEWALAGVPDLLGGRDDPASFQPRHPLLRETHRRNPGLRVPRTGLVLDALVPAVLEQKVTGQQAHQAWRFLLRRYGTEAPGPAPAGMRVPPPPETLLAVPTWDWHRAGVDLRRQRAIRAAATVAGRLEECGGLSPQDALARLRVLPGVGVWTAAEVAQRALGDADAVSVGDFHIPALVGWALLGRPLDDDGMLDLLEVYRPHRHRAVRLVEVSGVGKPRFGPRFSPIDYRRM
ncbi:MAG TPA: DNA-3-methyladenine glycosylase 2 family protein [Mycobacteriales bacterium]|nr:DNA-3-methyladenine glycosylase 2 family protein [Mycobacteriales bacterium]